LSGRAFAVASPEPEAVWVKAGNYKSGDGPGYGTRFTCPASVSDPVPPAQDN